MEKPDVTCTNCAKAVHWLSVFPDDICLECYEIKMENQTPQQMRQTIKEVFGV